MISWSWPSNFCDCFISLTIRLSLQPWWSRLGVAAAVSWCYFRRSCVISVGSDKQPVSSFGHSALRTWPLVQQKLWNHGAVAEVGGGRVKRIYVPRINKGSNSHYFTMRHIVQALYALSPKSTSSYLNSSAPVRASQNKPQPQSDRNPWQSGKEQRLFRSKELWGLISFIPHFSHVGLLKEQNKTTVKICVSHTWSQRLQYFDLSGRGRGGVLSEVSYY